MTIPRIGEYCVRLGSLPGGLLAPCGCPGTRIAREPGGREALFCERCGREILYAHVERLPIRGPVQ